jgi:co-chaperonin GroES (HSP10)
MGEPSTQAIMKAFHVGGANSSASGAFDRIQESLRLPQNLSNSGIEAVIVEQSGVITDIKRDPITGTVVKVGSKSYKLHQKSLADSVKVGASVEKGDLLTKEFDAEGTRLVIRNPHDVLKFQGVDVARSYLAQSIEEAYSAGDIKDTDRRHYEVVTKNLMNKAVITDPGTSPYMIGQEVPLTTIQKYNQMAGRNHTAAMSYANRLNVIGAVAAQDYSDPKAPMQTIVKKDEVITEAIWEKLKNRPHIKVKKKPLQFEQKLVGVAAKDLSAQNWLDTAAYGDATRIIGRAATMGMKDKLDTPLSRQMAGMKGNFAEGFQEFNANQNQNNAFVNGFL